MGAERKMTADSYRAGVPKVVVYLGADQDFAEDLRAPLVASGVDLRVCASGSDAAQALREAEGGLLLVDQRVGPSGGAEPDVADPAVVLEQTSALGATPTWVCLADGADLTARLGALRCGASACFTTPPPDLAARLLALLGVVTPEPYRVLVVDDQEVAAMVAGGILKQAGMVVRTVSEPMTVLQAMEEFLPDLVLMDLHMPGANGIELTGIIREHEAFCAIPVVFLSCEGDRDQQIDALRVGGDEFLAKPVSAELLVRAVRRRVERARSVQDRHGEAPEHDPITGLWTRGYLLQRIDRVILDDKARSGEYGVIYINIDPSPGLDALRRARALDAAMGRIAQAVSRVILRFDVAARLGERSLGILVGRPDEQLLAACAESLQAAVSGVPVTAGGVAVRLTASLGIGLFRPRADDAITIVSRAKAACAKARKAGGDRVESYIPTLPMGASPARSARLEELIREALRSDGLLLMYQPVVAVQRRAGERFEVVLRLRTKEGEFIPPFDFLPVAVQLGLMPTIDRWVLGRALDEFKTHRAVHPALSLLVRQTMATVAAPDWIGWVRDAIASRDLIRHRPVLMFELGDVAANLDLARERFVELQRLSIDLCLNHMDDSPAAREVLESFPWALARLQPETIGRKTTALTSLVGAIHQRGAQAIATGIEDPQAIARVWSCGVDFIQGNFIQPPGEGLEFDFAGTELI